MDMVEGMALFERQDWAGAYERFARYDDEDARDWAQKCIQTEIPPQISSIPDKYRTREMGTLNITNYLGRDIYFEVFSVDNNETVFGLYMTKENDFKYFVLGLKSGRYQFLLYYGPAWFGIEQKFGSGENAVFARTLTVDGSPDVWIGGSALCTMGIYDTYLDLEMYE